MDTRLITAENRDSWQEIGTVSIGRSTRRDRKYTRRPAKFPYQDLGRPGGTVKPGEYLAYCYQAEYGAGGTVEIAQFIGHVSAGPDGATVDKFKGLAVLVFSPQTAAIYERWIKPCDVIRVLDRAGDSLRLFAADGSERA